MASRIEKPIIEYKCAGKAVFKSGEEFKVAFSVRQLADGSIVGAVDFGKADQGTLMNLTLSDHAEFRLEGVESKYGMTLRAERCFFTRNYEFIALNVIVNPEALDRKIERPVEVFLDVTNVRQTFRVILDTSLGTLQLEHDKDIEDLEWLMDSMGISLVTSDVHIFAEKAVGMTVRQLIEKAEETVHGFLQVLRFGHTCWYDWCNLSVYEQEEPKKTATPETEMEPETTMKLVALKLRAPRKTLPLSKGIMTVANSDFFMKDAYKGYSKELEEKFGFDSSLYWYLESNTTEVIESKYLLACTCLELLTDRFVKQKDIEFIIPIELFNSLYEVLKDAAGTWLQDRGVEEAKRNLLYNALRGADRPSFKSRIEGLLQELGIRYDDIGLEIGKIIRLRNEITHTGTTASASLLDDYDKLYVVLTRIFLVLLGYGKDYYDFVKRNWVQMKDVLTT